MVAEPCTADDPETRLALFDFAFENAYRDCPRRSRGPHHSPSVAVDH